MDGLVIIGREKKGKSRGEERRKIGSGREGELAIPEKRIGVSWVGSVTGGSKLTASVAAHRAGPPQEPPARGELWTLGGQRKNVLITETICDRTIVLVS